MKVIAHARLASDCPLAPLNALYAPHGVMVDVLIDECNPDEPMSPTLMFNGVELYEALPGVLPPFHRMVIHEILTANSDVPYPVREAYMFEGRIAIPKHWVISLIDGAGVQKGTEECQ